jgi:uncharacterized protein YqjF (DUF2071 family)
LAERVAHIRNFGRKSQREETTPKPYAYVEDNIRMYLSETGWDVVYWMNLAQDRDQRRAFVNTVMKLRVP